MVSLTTSGMGFWSELFSLKLMGRVKVGYFLFSLNDVQSKLQVKTSENYFQNYHNQNIGIMYPNIISKVMGILTAGERLQTVGLAKVGGVGLPLEELARASEGTSDTHHICRKTKTRHVWMESSYLREPR